MRAPQEARSGQEHERARQKLASQSTATAATTTTTNDFDVRSGKLASLSGRLLSIKKRPAREKRVLQPAGRSSERRPEVIRLLRSASSSSPRFVPVLVPESALRSPKSCKYCFAIQLRHSDFVACRCRSLARTRFTCWRQWQWRRQLLLLLARNLPLSFLLRNSSRVVIPPELIYLAPTTPTSSARRNLDSSSRRRRRVRTRGGPRERSRRRHEEGSEKGTREPANARKLIEIFSHSTASIEFPPV